MIHMCTRVFKLAQDKYSFMCMLQVCELFKIYAATASVSVTIAFTIPLKDR